MRNLAVAALLLASSILAGCMDDDGDVSGASTTDDNLTDAGKQLVNLPNGTLPSAGGATGTNSSNDHLPHVHDYWEGRDRVLLADEAVDLEPWMVFNNLFGFRDPAVGGAWWTPAKGKTVYEGTGKLEITLDWQDATITGVAMAYRHASSREWSEWVVATKGSPTVIEVAPEMTDLPHSGGSRWAFLFKAAGTPAVAVGAMSLKMEIVRVRDLHAFPAHTDFWAGTKEIVLMDEDTRSQSRAWTTGLLNFAAGTEGEEGWRLPEGKIVPPGTQALVATIKPASATTRDVDLTYRDASGEWQRAEPLEESEPGTWTFLLPTSPQGVDSYYAASSQWEFYLFTRQAGNGQFQCGGCTDQTIDFHAYVVAHKVNPYAEAEPDR